MKARLLAFVDALRASGLVITAAETLDAMHAVAAMGIERASMREALAATLIKDEADRVTFDAVFERCFGLPARQRNRGTRPQSSGEATGQGTGVSTAPRSTPPPEKPPQSSPAARRTERPTDQPERRNEARVKPGRGEPDPPRLRAHELARQGTLLRLPFRDMSAQDIDDCAALVAELARRLRAHMSRRQRAAGRGRLDVRRTLRRSISSGGVPIAPAFRTRRPGRLDIVALCDYSYSVATVSNFFLALLAPAHEFFRRTRLFAFVDRPVEISLERGAVVPHERLDLYARSDFGRTLVDFWHHFEPLLTRNTVVLVLGDARNNRRPPRADRLARMRVLVRRIVWLNPEKPDLWDTGDSVMHVYARHCDATLTARTIAELHVALKQIIRDA